MKSFFYFIVKLIGSLGVAILIYLWSSNDIIATVLSFFAGTILIDFFCNRRIMHNKLKLKYKLSDFNEEYYDLYWESNMSRLNGFFNSFVFGLTICSFVDDFIKMSIEQYISVYLFIVLVPIIIYSLLLGFSKQEKILMQLFNLRKQNWSGDYTEEETNILKRIADL